MANSIITIVFTEDLPVNSKLGFNMNNPNTSFPLLIRETWVGNRAAANTVTSFGSYTPGPLSPDGTKTAYYYVQALNIDYNGYGLTIVRNENTVTISIPEPYTFELITQYFDYLNNIWIPFAKPSSVNVTIDNVDSDIFEITDISILTSDVNPCENVKISIETNELATEIIQPFALNPNTENPIIFEWPRGSNILLRIKNAAGSGILTPITLPTLLSESNFFVNVIYTPNGSTVTVTNENTYNLNIEYSIDNITWQTSNVFSSLPEGDYTLYVRDNYGCSFSKDFEIGQSILYSPIFYISKSNSIRYAQEITWGDSENYKTDENTLSCQSEVKLPYMETQLFQSADIIKTQFKSNYGSHVAKIVKEDLSEVIIPITKITNNIGIKDKRDARKYDLGNGKTGIYFLSGNIYDYNTNGITGNYALNGILTEWGVVGNYINIDGLWLIIENRIYDENKNADVLVVNQVYNGLEVNSIVSSIYNIFDYDVYEYSIDMVDYLNQTIQVKLDAIDTNFGELNFKSEKINVLVRHDNTLEIKYYNKDNTDIYYNSGITFLIRIPYTKIEGTFDEENELHKTDANVILLSADLYEGDKYIFEPVTKEMWRKLTRALSHKFVFINGVQYVKSAIENEPSIDDTNLYIVTATMLKAGIPYNSEGSSIINESSNGVEVPGLIQTESGFIKY